MKQIYINYEETKKIVLINISIHQFKFYFKKYS